MREIVLAVSRIPYGRPSVSTAEAVLEENRGTCSTKHLLLRDLLRERGVDVRLLHRSYVATRERFPCAAIPPGGVVDVHTYAIARIDGRDVRIDVTFPVDDWDGASDMPLQCGDGTDHEAGDDPLATKAALVAELCDPSVREPFIASFR
jgi:hypothetical protein